MKHWWGPKDFTTTSFKADARPGGTWHGVMRSPEGKNHAAHGVYREIVPPERIVFTFVWEDEPDYELLVTIIFTERNGKTEMTFRKVGFKSAESRDSQMGGWSECLDRFAAYVAKA